MDHMCLCVVLMMANIFVSILATRAERCVSEPSTRHLSARRPIRSRTVILGLQPGCISELLLLPSPSYRCYLVCVTLRHQIAEPCIWLVASARVCVFCVCVCIILNACTCSFPECLCVMCHSKLLLRPKRLVFQGAINTTASWRCQSAIFLSVCLCFAQCYAAKRMLASLHCVCKMCVVFFFVCHYV